ncbi:hypothetical protein Ac2012v2_000969 [Leucoagaricus gongylophorus]
MDQVIDLTLSSDEDEDYSDIEVIDPPKRLEQPPVQLHSNFGTRSSGASVSRFLSSREPDDGDADDDDEQEEDNGLLNLLRDILAADLPPLINGVDPFADLDELQRDDITLLHRRRFPPPAAATVAAAPPPPHRHHRQAPTPSSSCVPHKGMRNKDIEGVQAILEQIIKNEMRNIEESQRKLEELQTMLATLNKKDK